MAQSAESYYTPSWRDVIHITPRPIITPEEREAHRRAIRKGLPSPLSPEQLAEIQRRKQRAIAISRSQIPEWRQRMITALTMIDDIQDAVATAAWLARAIGVFYPPALPVAGGLMTAATILDMIMLIDPLRWATKDLKRAVRDKQRANPRGKTMRRGVQGGTDAKPWSWGPQADKWARDAATRNRAAGEAISKLLPKKYRDAWAKAAQMAPTLAEAIQAAQTTDQFIGIGLSLGPIFGAGEEQFWRRIRGDQGQAGAQAAKATRAVGGKIQVETGQ